MSLREDLISLVVKQSHDTWHMSNDGADEIINLVLDDITVRFHNHYSPENIKSFTYEDAIKPPHEVLIGIIDSLKP